MNSEEIRRKYGNDIANAFEQASKTVDQLATSVEIADSLADTVTKDLRREAAKRTAHAVLGMLQLCDSPAQRSVIAMGCAEEVLAALAVTVAPLGGQQAKDMAEMGLDYPVMLFVLGQQIFDGMINKQLERLGTTREAMREMGPEAFVELLKREGHKIKASHG